MLGGFVDDRIGVYFMVHSWYASSEIDSAHGVCWGAAWGVRSACVCMVFACACLLGVGESARPALVSSAPATSPSSALPRPCHRPRLFSHGSDGASAFGRRPCGGSGGRHSSGASRRGRRARPRGGCRGSRSSSAPGAAGSHHPGSRAEEGADARAERPRGGSQEGAAGPPACCEEDADPPHRRDRPVPARAGRRRLVGAAGVGPAGASGFRHCPRRAPRCRVALALAGRRWGRA